MLYVLNDVVGDSHFEISSRISGRLSSWLDGLEKVNKSEQLNGSKILRDGNFSINEEIQFLQPNEAYSSTEMDSFVDY